MELDYNTITGILSILGSVVAAYLSYRIYVCNRLNKSWLAVTLAFLLIIIRRSIGFMISGKILPDWVGALQTAENTLLVVISVLYIWGFWSMLKSFENFDVVEKKTREKTRAFNKRR